MHHILVGDHENNGGSNTFEIDCVDNCNYDNNEGYNYEISAETENWLLDVALILLAIAAVIGIATFLVVSQLFGGPFVLLGISIAIMLGTGVFMISWPSFLVIALHIKYYVLYSLVGFFYVGWWEHLIPLSEELADDYIRGVTYPLHVAYMNVQNLYPETFHILDTKQNALFYFWLIPGLTFSTLPF